MVADVSIMDSLGKSYRAFGEWGMVAGKVEVLLVVSGLMWTEVQKPSLLTCMKYQGR